MRPCSSGADGGEHAGLEGEVGAQPGEGKRGTEELGVGGRDEIVVGVELVQGLAGGEVHDLYAPEGGARGGRGIDQFLDALRQGGGTDSWAHKQKQRGGEFHLPVTFDSSQIRSSSAITRNVPSSGIPTTTPTPHFDAAYPSVAGASRPPTSAKEKIPLKNPGW